MAASAAEPAPGPAPLWRRPNRAVLVVAVLIGWGVLAAILKNKWTLALAQSDTTALHRWLNSVNNWVTDHRNSSPIFLYFFNEISLGVGHLVTFLQSLISQPSYGRPVPVIGWLGVVALMGFLGYAFGTLRVALLAVIGFVFLGLQGLWQDSMDTLASVVIGTALTMVFGVVIGVWMGRSRRVDSIIRPVLDAAQEFSDQTRSVIDDLPSGPIVHEEVLLALDDTPFDEHDAHVRYDARLGKTAEFLLIRVPRLTLTVLIRRFKK